MSNDNKPTISALNASNSSVTPLDMDQGGAEAASPRMHPDFDPDRLWRQRNWIYNAQANGRFGTLNDHVGQIETYLDALPDRANKILHVSTIRTFPWIWAGLAREMVVLICDPPANSSERLIDTGHHHLSALRIRSKTSGARDSCRQLAPADLSKGVVVLGDNKGGVVLMSGKALVAAGNAVADHFGLKAGDVIHSSLPWQSVSGFVAGPMAALAAGATWSPAPTMEGTDGAQYFGSIYRFRATHVVLDRTTLRRALTADALFEDSFQTMDLQKVTLFDDQPYNPLDHQSFARKFGVELTFVHGTDRFGGGCFGFGGSDAADSTLGWPIGAELKSNGGPGGLTLRGERFRLKHIAQPKITDLTARLEFEALLETGYRTCFDDAGRIRLVGVNQESEGHLVPSALEKDVYRLAAERFKVDANSLGRHSTGENTPGWSSLTSVELVLTLEEHFEIAFSPREVMRMISLGDVIDAVQKHVPEV